MTYRFKYALLLAGALLAQAAAQAGELTLYEHDNFGGRGLTLRDPTPNLRELGFNDRASSMVVQSGRWEICTDADFRGACKVVEAGEYPSLERLNDTISSVREVDWRRHEHERGPRGMLELFTQPGLHGNSMRLEGDSEDFGRIGFNDRGYSLQIEAGNWELCSDAGYRGNCRVFGPGRYRDLGYGLAGQVSSARLVGGNGWRGGRDDTGGRDDRAEAAPPASAPVLLFPEEGMRGDALALAADAPDFNALGFNDRAASLLINEGQWEFCLHANFGGQCVIYGPGRYPLLGVLSKRISSMRRVRF